MAATHAVPDADRAEGAGEAPAKLVRAGTFEKAVEGMNLQRAGTLPTEDKDLRHAATMPITHDVESHRPFCGGLWKTQQLAGFLLGLFCLAVSIGAPIENRSAAHMLGITLMCGWFWVTEVLPIYITALLPLVLMPIFGITTSQIAAKAYWDPIMMLLIGAFLVDIAIEEVHLPRRCALKLLMATGVVEPALLLFLFMFVCWFLSMFVNNIAVTLMVTPFAVSLVHAAEERAMDQAADLEVSETGSNPAAQQFERFSLGLLLGIAYSTTAGGMATLIGSIPNELLLSQGALSQQVDYVSWMVYAFPASLTTFLMAYGLVWFRYVRGVSSRVVTHDMLVMEYQELTKEIGHFSRDELVVAIAQVVQFALLFCKPWIGKLAIFETDFGEPLIGDSTLACIPSIALFFCPSAKRPGQSVLTWITVHEKFDFGLLLLIGGGFAIASGFVQSGLNLSLGNWVASAIVEVPLFVLTLIIVLVCTIATQVFSAVGTATTVIPMLTSAAARAVSNPLGLVLPATAACSFAFALPTATPANVIVLAKSRDLLTPLRVRDFCFTGLPLSLLMVVLGSTILYYTGEAVFETSSPFPQWACDGVGCIWANASGFVRGVEVMSQACTLDPMGNMTTCRLANGSDVDFDSVYIPH